MMMARFKKWLVAFSISVIAAGTAVFACGGGDYEDWNWTYATNFTPETFINNDYAPLFLSESLFYTNNGLPDNTDAFNADMVSEWSEFLKGAVDQEAVSFFLLDTTGANADKIYEFYKSGKQNAITSKWSKKINLKNARAKQFITFLHYAKQVEPYSNDKDSWNYYGAPERKYFEDSQVLAELAKLYEKT